jgi:hypothetical protein
MPGVVPFQTTGFPEGAGSAKEAVMKQIASENQAQQNMNQSFGGAAKRKQSRRKQSSKRHSRSAKRSSAKHKRSSSRRKQSSKRKQISKKRTYKKVIYRGGEGELEAGKEVSVPQFGSTNNSGPLNPNALSAKLNEVSLAQYQGAIHDKEINNV